MLNWKLYLCALVLIICIEAAQPARHRRDLALSRYGRGTSMKDVMKKALDSGESDSSDEEESDSEDKEKETKKSKKPKKSGTKKPKGSEEIKVRSMKASSGKKFAAVFIYKTPDMAPN